MDNTTLLAITLAAAEAYETMKKNGASNKDLETIKELFINAIFKNDKDEEKDTPDIP